MHLEWGFRVSGRQHELIMHVVWVLRVASMLQGYSCNAASATGLTDWSWDGRRFAVEIFKCNFLNENVRISIKNSPKSVPKEGPTNNILELVKIMA